jgi:predicted nucleic acid-binding protein
VLASDASLIVELALDRIGEDASSALGDEELIAPPLLWSEVPSVLHELAFRGEISRALGERALQRFLDEDRHPATPTAVVDTSPTAAPANQHCLPASPRGLLEPGAVKPHARF